MPLAAIDAFIDLLACPRCGGELTGSPAKPVPSQRSCGHRYEAVGDRPKPVLVDSDASIMDVGPELKRVAGPVPWSAGTAGGC